MSEKIRREELTTFDDLLEASLREDEDFAHRWKVSEVVARFGANVFQERTRQEMSQETLAEEVGTGQPNISRIEHAAGNPTLETMAKIARALEVDLSELVRAKKSRFDMKTISIEEGRRRRRSERGPDRRFTEPWSQDTRNRGRRVDQFAPGPVEVNDVAALA